MHSRLKTPFLIILVAIVVTFIIMMLRVATTMPQASLVQCLPDEIVETNASELSAHLGIPIVTLTEPRHIASITSEVTLDIEYPLESPVCGLMITYKDVDAVTPLVVIEVMKAEQMGQLNNWSCLDFENKLEENQQNLRSICSGVISTADGYLFVRVSSNQGAEETRYFAEHIDVQS